MSEIQIYHNPRCSKSRQTLALLTEQGIQPEVVEYLKTPPTEQTLRIILEQLNMTARDLLRTGEAVYKELKLSDKSISDQELISAMCKYPKLIERPIVIHDGKAKIGRPPEAVLEIL